MHALIDDRYHFIGNPRGAVDELFDYRADTAETHNLATTPDGVVLSAKYLVRREPRRDALSKSGWQAKSAFLALLCILNDCLGDCDRRGSAAGGGRRAASHSGSRLHLVESRVCLDQPPAGDVLPDTIAAIPLVFIGMIRVRAADVPFWDSCSVRLGSGVGTACPGTPPSRRPRRRHRYWNACGGVACCR